MSLTSRDVLDARSSVSPREVTDARSDETVKVAKTRAE
jgi:hypothetical protein